MAGQSSSDIRAIITAAFDEARQRGDRLLGSEHLFLGLLHEPDSAATRALGVDLSAARAALGALDRAALAAIGLDVAGLPVASLAPLRKGPRMSSAARTAITRAGKEAVQTKARSIESTHMALALLASQPPDPVTALMAELRIDRAAVRERLNRVES
ncbi:MAG: Clp protease N-terminal domain-containing protein [Ktedonobacterales bacterium]